MPKLTQQIETILFFRSEPVKVAELQKLLNASKVEIEEALKHLQDFYKDRGMVVVSDGESYSFGTHPDNFELIEKINKEELSQELGRAGLETLAVILYRSAPDAPISRREIDQIRGVNSGFTLRSLMIRGLIERTQGLKGERSFAYKPTLKLLEHLGITRREDLPEFESAFKKLEAFITSEPPDHA